MSAFTNISSAFDYLVKHLNTHQGTAQQIARMLLEDLFGVSALKDLRGLNESERNQVLFSLDRLNQGEPLQYVTGIAHFYGLHLAVNRSVLIPRPETEELVFEVIATMKKDHRPDLKVLDIGTGSGCIGLAIRNEMKKSLVTVMDKSYEALEVCQRNSRHLNLPLEIIKDDITSPSAEELIKGSWHYIVSNPPYISDAERSGLELHVINFEPHAALFPDQMDPLRMYEFIIQYSRDHLISNGFLFLELNEFLAPEVKSLVDSMGFAEVDILKDMQGKQRILKAKKSEKWKVES